MGITSKETKDLVRFLTRAQKATAKSKLRFGPPLKCKCGHTQDAHGHGKQCRVLAFDTDAHGQAVAAVRCQCNKYKESRKWTP